MKTPTACHQCRTAKRKCERVDLTAACLSCEQRHQPCSYSRVTTKHARLAPIINDSGQARNHDAELVLSSHVQTELVEHYLHFIHDRPHSLFHKPTLRHHVETGQIKEPLLLAICALGCRFSSDAATRSWGPQLTARAASMFYHDLEHVCLESIQTAVLLANLYAAELQHASEALYFSIAVRMAQLLRLATPSDADTLLLQETKRRVWWTLFMADRWCSSGLGLPFQLEQSQQTVGRPLDEKTFHTPDFAHMNLRPPCRPGLWAYMVILVDIFGLIQGLNHRLVQLDPCHQRIDEEIQQLESQLDAWEHDLPPAIKCTDENLATHARQGQGGTFVALHLGYHHYSALLFFSYLDDTRQTPTMQSQHCVQKCRHHALSYARLLELSRRVESCEAVYVTVGHMTVISSSVLLHVLLFGHEPDLDSARQALLSNFDALVELKTYWPALSHHIQRLFTFQNACLLSTDPNPHRVDRWMLKFLLEYARPLEGRAAQDTTHEDQQDGTLSKPFVTKEMAQRYQMTDDVLSSLL